MDYPFSTSVVHICVRQLLPLRIYISCVPNEVESGIGYFGGASRCAAIATFSDWVTERNFARRSDSPIWPRGHC